MKLTDKMSLKLIWQWLWGIPDKEKVALEEAKASLEAMQKNVAQLAEALAKVVEANKRASLRYEAKQQEAKEMLEKAQLAYKSGNQEDAKIAMTQVIMIEKMLPHLANVVSKSGQVVVDVTQKLSREQEKIEIYKLEMDNLDFFREINTIMQNVATTPESPFNGLRDKIESLKFNIEILDSEKSCEQLLEQLNLDDQIEQRLQQK